MKLCTENRSGLDDWVTCASLGMCFHELITWLWKRNFLFHLQQLNKRHLKRSRSLVSVLLRGESEDEDFGKAKNIRQTELLVDLREAILQVARHFQSLDPKNNKVVSIPDFPQSRLYNESYCQWQDCRIISSRYCCMCLSDSFLKSKRP